LCPHDFMPMSQVLINMLTLEQKCRAYCRRQKIDPDMLASKAWQAAPGPRTNGRVLMWHTVICEVQRKPVTNNRDKEVEARKAELQRMIDESNPKRPGKRYSCYDGEDE